MVFTFRLDNANFSKIPFLVSVFDAKVQVKQRINCHENNYKCIA